MYFNIDSSLLGKISSLNSRILLGFANSILYVLCDKTWVGGGPNWLFIDCTVGCIGNVFGNT